MGAVALFVLLTDGNLATPLYAVYRQHFGFSATELTLIFATYTIVLIPSLLLFGQLSDRVGRQPVLVGGLLAGAVGLALLATAKDTAWLFVARAVQGASLGAVVGTAAAALVELHPDGDHERAALATVLAQSGGSAAGPLLAGALAQWAPAPLHLPYIVGIAATLLTALLVAAIREPREPSGEWRLQRPSVPRAERRRFARASLTGASVWAVGSLYLSVIPSYAAKLLDTSDLALLGAISALMLAAACPVQVLGVRDLFRRAPRSPPGSCCWWPAWRYWCSPSPRSRSRSCSPPRCSAASGSGWATSAHRPRSTSSRRPSGVERSRRRSSPASIPA